MLTQFAPYLKDIGAAMFFSMLLAFGMLIPRWTLNRLLAMQVAMTQIYKEAYENQLKRSDNEAARGDLLAEQQAELLVYAKGSSEVLMAWQRTLQQSSREPA